MIWHIVKKDWKLLWPYVLLLAAVELSYVILLTLQPIKQVEFYGADPATDTVYSILQAAILIAGALLIARLSHNDAIPGDRQDWLVRPIGRRHLLGAKMLGLALFVQVPLWVIDVIYGVLNGFPLVDAVMAAAGHGLLVFVALSLPVLALCSTSRNFAEAVAMGIILALASAIFTTVTGAFHWPLVRFFRIPSETPLGWIPYVAGYIVLCIGAIVVLCLQFYRRTTLLSRMLVCATWAGLGFAVAFFPWKTAFAIQTRFAEQRGLGSSITLAFDPSIGRLRRPPSFPGQGDSELFIPIQVQGLPPDTVLRAELWDSYAVTQSGRIIPFSRDKQQNFMMNGPAHLTLGLMSLTGYAPEEPRNNPETKNKSFQLEIELSVTLLKSDEVTALPSVWGGRSLTKRPCRLMSTSIMHAYGDVADPRDFDVEFICAPVVVKAPCVSMVLVDLPSPWMQRASLTCFRMYSPFHEHLLSGGDGAVAHAFFYDPARIEDYFGADSDKLGKTKLELHWYKPVDHFTRRLVIPNVSLKDWIRETP
jgi:cytochrome b561